MAQQSLRSFRGGPFSFQEHKWDDASFEAPFFQEPVAAPRRASRWLRLSAGCFHRGVDKDAAVQAKEDLSPARCPERTQMSLPTQSDCANSDGQKPFLRPMRTVPAKRYSSSLTRQQQTECSFGTEVLEEQAQHDCSERLVGCRLWKTRRWESNQSQKHTRNSGKDRGRAFRARKGKPHCPQIGERRKWNQKRASPARTRRQEGKGWGLGSVSWFTLDSGWEGWGLSPHLAVKSWGGRRCVRYGLVQPAVLMQSIPCPSHVHFLVCQKPFVVLR